MSEPVYVVRLTEERLMDALRDDNFPADFAALLMDATPEHPERQAALELLYATAIAIDWPQSGLNGYREFIKALAHARAMEPKP